MKLPLTAYELIDQLDTLFPEVVFSTDIPRDEFLLKSGERRLVLYLKHCVAQEREDARQGRR